MIHYVQITKCTVWYNLICMMLTCDWENYCPSWKEKGN